MIGYALRRSELAALTFRCVLAMAILAATESDQPLSAAEIDRLLASPKGV